MSEIFSQNTDNQFLNKACKRPNIGPLSAKVANDQFGRTHSMKQSGRGRLQLQINIEQSQICDLRCDAVMTSVMPLTCSVIQYCLHRGFYRYKKAQHY